MADYESVIFTNIPFLQPFRVSGFHALSASHPEFGFIHAGGTHPVCNICVLFDLLGRI